MNETRLDTMITCRRRTEGKGSEQAGRGGRGQGDTGGHGKVCEGAGGGGVRTAYGGWE